MLEKKYGKEEAAKRIYATTDKERGALKNLATEEGYESFVVPDDVGGRFFRSDSSRTSSDRCKWSGYYETDGRCGIRQKSSAGAFL